MVDSQLCAESELNANDDIELRLSAKTDYLSIVRIVAAHTAKRAELDADGVFDFKLAVDEACSSLLTHAVSPSALCCRFTIGDDEIMFTVTGTSAEYMTADPSAVGWRMLATLTDSVARWVQQVEDTPYHVRIEFIKRRPTVAR